MSEILYCRYSDDLLIIGERAEQGKALLERRLGEMELTLNPEKVEPLFKDQWFKFLGFQIKGRHITLSKSRIKKFQKEIVERTIKNPFIKEGEAKRSVISYLYEGDRNWATSCLGTVNCEKDLLEMNNFIMDCLRAVKVRELKQQKRPISISKIGGLGVTQGQDFTICRGKGSNVKRNLSLTEKHIENYLTMNCLANAMKQHACVFQACVRGL